MRIEGHGRLLGLALVVGAAAGLLAGAAPPLAIAGAAAIAFLALTVVDFPFALLVFVLLTVLNLGADAPLSPTKGAGLALVAAWVVWLLTRRAPARPGTVALSPALHLLLASFLGWAAISFLWAHDLAAASDSLNRFLQNAAVFGLVAMAVAQQSRAWIWIAAAFVAGVCMTAALGLAFSYESASINEAPRLAGTAQEPNELAAILVAALVLAAALALSARTVLGRLASASAAAFCLPCLALTASRGGAVALAAALVAVVVLAGRRRLLIGSVVTIVVGVLVVGFVALAPPGVQARFSDESGTGREELWTVAGRMIADNPMLGVGTGNFRSRSIDYLVAPGVIAKDEFIVSTPYVPHNVYLEVLSETGVVGLVLFMGLLAACLSAFVRAGLDFEAAGRPRTGVLARAFAVATVGLLAADLFASELYSKNLWLLLALAPAVRLAGHHALASAADRRPARGSLAGATDTSTRRSRAVPAEVV